MSKLILDYISKDPISYVHIRDLLDRNYTIIYESANGFIIHDDEVDFTYISFSNKEEMIEQLSKNRYYHYLTYDKEVVDFYNDEDLVIKLHQFSYPNAKPFILEGYDLRVLSQDYAKVIDGFYKAIGPGETSIEVLKKNNVIGIFEDDNLAGIIGRHPEGCVGMLHVFENYRHKGYGEVLEKAMINKLIKEKQRVFCEVVDGNTVSMHLQSKIGFTKGDKIIYWLV